MRKGVLADNRALSGQVHSLDVEVELLSDNLGCDPGLMDIPLRSAWEDISWVEFSIAGALQTALLHLQNLSPSPSLQEVQHIVSSVLIPSSKQAFEINPKVAALEFSLATHLPRLTNLYSVCSGRASKQPAKALAAKLNSIAEQIFILENHVASAAPIFGLGNQSVAPLPSPSSSVLGAVKTQVLKLDQKQQDL